MRNWTKWCINNNLSLLVYFIHIMVSPLYLLVYIPESFSDWKADKKRIEEEVARVKGRDC